MQCLVMGGHQGPGGSREFHLRTSALTASQTSCGIAAKMLAPEDLHVMHDHAGWWLDASCAICASLQP